MEVSLIIITIVFFAGYGLKSFWLSMTAYFESLKTGQDKLVTHAEDNKSSQEEIIRLLTKQLKNSENGNLDVRQQSTFNSDNVVDFRKSGTSDQVEVEFHDDEPAVYNREG